MNRRVVVVGGGITGLAAAHRTLELARAQNIALEVLLCEAGPRLGGVIASHRINGFLVEDGPDGFLTEKPWAVDMCARLNLTERLISTESAHRSVYVARGGMLVPLPEGFFLMAPTRLGPALRTPIFSWRGKARLALEPLIPRRRASNDESLASFVRRRLGREVLERVAQPLVGGIYGADPEEMSLAATLPRFLTQERVHGSLWRATRQERRQREAATGSGSGARYSLFVSLAGGMQEMIDALSAKLPPAAVRLGTRVTRLERVDGHWEALLPEHEKIRADAIIVATPAPAAAELLSPSAGVASGKLKAIAYASTATVNLAYRRDEIPHPLDAFGFVVPAVEQRSLTACTFSSVKYRGRAPADFVLLRAFVGGALQARELDRDDAAIEAAVRRDFADLLSIRAAPLFCRIRRYANAMPQYRVGHLDLVGTIASAIRDLPGLALAGSGYRGVGIPDCVRDGEEAAAAIVNQFGGALG